MSHRDRLIVPTASVLAISMLAAPFSRAAASFAVIMVPAGASVKLNGRRVVTLHTNNLGMQPAERAALAVRRLQIFLSAGGSRMAIEARPLKEGAGVYASDRLVLVATAAEAAAHRRTPAALAAQWACNLRLGLASPSKKPIGSQTVPWRSAAPSQAPGTHAGGGDPRSGGAGPRGEAGGGDGTRRWTRSRSASVVTPGSAPPSSTPGPKSGVPGTDGGTKERPARSSPESKLQLAVPITAHHAASGGTRSTINFNRADIADIVNTLSVQQHVNIALTPNAKGVVSVRLSNVTTEQALRLITRLAGLDYIQSSGAYVIGTPSELQTIAARAGTSRTQPLRFLTFQDAKELLANAHPYVTVKPTRSGNAIQLIGNPDEVSSACRVLEQADVSSAATPPTVETVTPQHIESEELRDILSHVLPDVRVVKQGPILILCGMASGIDQVHKLIASVDVAAAEHKTTFIYDLKFVSANEVQDTLKLVLPNLLVAPSPEAYAPPSAQFNPLSTVVAGAAGGAGGSAGSSVGAGAYGGLSGTPGAETGGAGPAHAKRSRARSIVLVGTEEDIAQARALLDKTDVAPPQVLIEARVVELTPEASRALGVSYSNPLIDTTISEEPLTPGSGIQFGRFTRSPVSFRVTLNALITQQLARLLASPSIAVVDNEDANIFIGDLVKYTSSQTTDLQGRLQFTIDTQPVGITLLVRPHVNAGGEITMKLHPVVSTLVQGFNHPGNGSLPQVRSREADTTVRLRDGEMLAIGGLISEEQIRAMERIPILSDLPLIGELFKNRINRRTRTELTVIITPRIVRPGEPIPQPVFSAKPELPDVRLPRK